jgi:hypothetical protein
MARRLKRYFCELFMYQLLIHLQVTDANSNHQPPVEEVTNIPPANQTKDSVLEATTRLAAVVVNMCREQKVQSEQYLDFVKVSAYFTWIRAPQKFLLLSPGR